MLNHWKFKGKHWTIKRSRWKNTAETIQHTLILTQTTKSNLWKFTCIRWKKRNDFYNNAEAIITCGCQMPCQINRNPKTINGNTHVTHELIKPYKQANIIAGCQTKAMQNHWAPQKMENKRIANPSTC